MTEHMPLSIASQRLQELGFGRRSGEPPTAITKPPFVQIRDALVRTEIDTLWSPMSGVLFWVCLIAGAAASKATPLNPQQEMSGDEVEANECRKFFCAVAVRCMIKLVFDDPNTILESLRRMNRIQMRLHIRYYDLPDPGIVPADGREGQGPAQGPQPPIGILDYAWEFINLPPDRELPFTSSAPDAVSGA
ncbi:hypothetical protein K431DRAFT_152424 [Polychaeton citri CBS 116435]|uniref:Uncharacterized protein n=1 Tax=Polychaeton citri CBS 116435 TaxID=1314669 RepID=A0A9P4Q3A0_9PEZI|nr:hypothetical protein K431DRAFT_152424 [Polychaeton citri CBS 116435]